MHQQRKERHPRMPEFDPTECEGHALPVDRRRIPLGQGNAARRQGDHEGADPGPSELWYPSSEIDMMDGVFSAGFYELVRRKYKDLA